MPERLQPQHIELHPAPSGTAVTWRGHELASYSRAPAGSWQASEPSGEKIYVPHHVAYGSESMLLSHVLEYLASKAFQARLASEAAGQTH